MSTGTCRWLFLLLFLIIWTKHSNSKEIRVVCYYTNWSVYRPGTAKFSPQNINPYLCTHLIYAFGGFTKENTLKPFDKYQDIEKGGYAKFTGLKTYNKNLKTMLAIGGWNEGSSRFSPMVANPERRKELIKNAIKFLRQNHFDGLDLDWEYPSFRDGGKSRDRDNYAQLVQELREEFERESEKTGRPRLLLTMAVPAGIEYINKGYDVPKLTKYLDWMNILSYDYHSAFEPAVNHHAPLYPLEEPSEYNYDTELNIDYTIEHYLKKGADPNKLVLGIPTYGRSYTLFNPDANEIGAPADGPGDMGEATRENGYLAYYEICENIKSQDWEVVQPNEEAMGPYAFKDNQWVGYDDDEIARKKAAYVAKKNLGGIMFWSIDNDDFRGTCHGKPYPIIEAAKEALISAYGLTDENLVSPPAKPTKTKTRTRTQSSSKSSGSKTEENEKKVSTSIGSRRRNRVKSKSDSTSSSNRSKLRRKESRSTTEGTVYSSLELVTPSYTTPAPPPTPGMGGEFKCEDEGFYPHPKDCKKYFWCLSGPGELGIVAHQFTCPAGLYFNKAADSCDYTRNVLCNKKLSKGTTTTTTAATTSKTPATSTARVPPKITAATSRTTVFRTSTTTEAYEDEYEEYDDDEEEDSKNSEEDPRVIKELLDLIKKAGGIEELEKQLKLQEDGSVSVSHSDTTTPSSISKSLVERVLGKAAKKDSRKTNSYSFLNRNSRGPQNDGLKTSEEKEKQERGRPKYTTITRQRAQKSEDNESDEDEDDEKTNDKPQRSSKKQPEYVNIRRGRISTTEEPDENSKTQINRNKILGEDDDSDDDENEEEETNKKKAVSPQYVNIRRQRPATTEETSTSKYTVLRRGTTTEAEEIDNTSSKKRGTSDPESSSTEKIDTKSKYKIVRRGSTTEASTTESDSTSSSKRRGTTTFSVEEETEKTKTRGSVTASIEEKYKTLKRGSTTASTANTEETPSEDSTLKSVRTTSAQEEANNTTVSSKTDNPITVEQILISSPDSLTLKTTASISTTNRPLDSKIDSLLSSNGSGEKVYQTQTPQLLEPRPFSLSTSGPTSSLKPVTESSTRVTKVSDPNYKLRLRQKLPSTQTEVVSTTTLTTEKPTPFRTRAPSRYKQNTSNNLDHQTSRPTIKPSVRARKRFSTTTEQYSDSFEEYDVERTFRPSEIADLSSLTAVDFTSLKDINRFNSPSRQRRPRPTFATSTTEKPEDSLKTGSRTLPLARKLLDGTTFGKSRRVFPNKNEQKAEDQINSSSDTTNRVRPFTRAPNNFTATTERTTKPTLRNRKVIRRLRPTVGSKLQAQNSSENNSIVFKKLGRPSSTPATETENLIENASSNSLYNRRFNRPSSTIADEVNKLSSTTESLERTNKSSKKEDDEHNETLDDVSGEEGENIRLSESNIRENSNVNNQNVLNEDDGKKVRKKVLKRIRNKVDDDKVTTEPNVIIRTRKIIRKLQPTDSSLLSITSTTESIEASTQNRKRKIIRRLRPTAIPSLSTAEPPTEKTLHIRGRPFLTHFNTETTPISEETEVPTGKNKYTTSKYKTITRTTTSRETDEEDEEHEKDDFEDSLKKTRPITFGRTSTKTIDTDASSPRSIDRSKYSTLNRGTTSTTTRYGTDLEDVEDEYEKKEVGTQGQTKYRIYRPTVFHNNDENDDDDDDEYEGEVEDDKNEKQINGDSLNIRILRPNLEKEATDDTSELEVSNENKDLNSDKDNTKNENVDLLTTEAPLSNESETEKEKHEKNEEEEEEEEEEDITTTTTIRNYVNPILNRQKNRPAFVRPKLTTQNPLRSSTTSKLRYRTFSRSTTIRPSQLQTSLEEEKDEVDDTKTERKFVPKSYNRSRYVTTGRENRTSETSEDTSLEITNGTQTVNVETEDLSLNSTNSTDEIPDNVEITTLEIDSIEETLNNTNIDGESTQNLTTQDISTTTTTSYSKNDTLNVFDDVTNETLIFTSDNKTFIPEVTTITTIDLTTIKHIDITEEDSYNDTNSLNNITIDATGEFNTSSSTERETNETTLGENNSDSTNNTTTDGLLDVSNSGESEFNDTVINHNDLSIPADTTTETTPVYQPKSTLRSILSRPKYSVPKRLTSTESPSAASRTTHKFNQRNPTTRPKLLTPNLRSTTQSSAPKNRFLYNRYSTTERHRFTTKDKNEDKDEYEDDVPDDDEDVEDEPEEQVNTPQTSPRSYSSKSKPRISNKPDGFSFRKTTEAPKVSEDLGIDTEAVRNRNKNLFSKKRKMNTPHVSQNPSTSEEKPVTENTSQATLTTTPAISESVTKPTQEFETTEHLTTLHHVFAQTELISGNKSATDETATPSTDIAKPSNAKLERLIEVNRIVEVNDKNNTVVHTDNKQVDKIGVINRVTVVKIVDGNPSPEENEIAEEKSESTTVSPKNVGVDGSFEIATVREIPNVDPRSGFDTELSPDRQNRKFEIYGESKVVGYNSKDSTNNQKGAEIIDGRSNINIITPRPYYSTEASTISLEALFQTDTPQKLNNINVNQLKTLNDDELLETGNSHYINVRVLGQGKQANDESQIIPIRVPKEEDYITMKAEVVEVTPKISKEFIKIVPIQVEMSRKLILNSDFDKKVENGVPKVNFQILKSANNN